jgi:hypothetical protein
MGNEFTSVLKMKAVYSPETSVTTYQTRRCHNPEVHNMNLPHLYEHLQPHMLTMNFDTGL